MLHLGSLSQMQEPALQFAPGEKASFWALEVYQVPQRERNTDKAKLFRVKTYTVKSETKIAF